MPRSAIERLQQTDLQFAAAPVEIKAAESEGGLKRFSMVAYNGGPMHPAGFSVAPVVVDLSGMRGTGTRRKPILLDHDTAKRVGHSDSIAVEGGSLVATGIVSGASPSAAEVSQSSLNGFPWQASIGASIDKVVELAEGKMLTVNGQQITGPAYIVRASTLREISFVTLGADGSTSASISARRATITEDRMKFEEWLKAKGFDVETLSEAQTESLKAMHAAEIKAAAAPAPATVPAVQPATIQATQSNEPSAVEKVRAEIAAEETRCSDIRKILAGHDDLEIEVDGHKVNLKAHAIAKNLTAKDVELHVLRATRPAAPSIHVSTKDHGADVIEAAIAQTGRLEGIEKHFTDKQLQAAHTAYKGRIGLQQILLAAAWLGGYDSRHFDKTGSGLKSILRAAFTSVSLPGVLSNSANKFMLAAFNAVESTWRKIAATRNVSDFKEVTSYRMNGDLKFEKLGASGEIPHGELGEASFSNKASTRGKMLAITREMIVNDDMGALTSLPRMIGRGGALSLNEEFWKVFLDNADFFKSANKNFGNGDPLSLAGLTAAELLFLDQTDADGNPLGLSPQILLVPNALYVPAVNLMKSVEIRPGGSSDEPISNPHAGKFSVEKSSYLNNAAIPGGSAEDWYLLANPADEATIEVAFLNGVESPTVESAEADFDVLGIQMRGYFDFGVGKREHRAGVKMQAEAEE